MIKNYTLKALQMAINRALQLDDQLVEKMSSVQGKTIELVIAPLNISFFIHFQAQQVTLHAEYTSMADVVIHSSPLGLIRLSFLPASKVRSLFNDQIHMTGDVLLGQQVKQLFDSLELDWEGHLAQFTGDVVAFQIGSIFRRGRALQQRVSESFSANITEYLQEELRLFPSREELADFFVDIDEVSLAVERLAARVNQLIVSYEID